jgi:hypothetical protein
MNIYDLTDKQKNAFKSLETAFNKCAKAGIVFINHNEQISAFDSSLVIGGTDDKNEGHIPLEMIDLNNFKADIDQWIDCEVFVKLTEKGISLISNNQ